MKSAKPIAAPLEYTRRTSLRVWVGGVLVFLYTPLLALMIFSFNNSKYAVVWKGFSLQHYIKFFHDEDLMIAFGNSLTIAFFSTIVSLVLGVISGVLMWRFRFPLKGVVEGALSLPIVVPEICMGVAMLIFFNKLEFADDYYWPFSLMTIILAHITFSFPFVTVVIRARLTSFNRELEEGAKDLGASEFQIFKDILVPHLTPAIVAGALLAFTLSLDDFVITFFTAPPDAITFPVKIYSMLRFSVTPEVNAASTILIVLTVFLTAIALRIQSRNQISAH